MSFHGKQIDDGTIDPVKMDTGGYNPSADGDVTTVQYVTAVLEGLKPKEAVRVGAIGNIADLGAAASTIDDVALSNGDRVLLKDQTDPIENGVYDWNANVLTRSADFDDAPSNEVVEGTFIFVTEGTLGAGKGWFVSGTASVGADVIIDTDPILWSLRSDVVGYVAGNGIVFSGNAITVDAGDGLTFSGNALTLNLLAGGGLTNGASGVGVNTDGINETHLDVGSGANQIDATTIPIDSTGSWAGAAANVQDALEELEGSITGAAITSGSGTTANGTAVDLGGLLTGDATIDANGVHAITFQGYDGGLWFQDTTGGGTFFQDTGAGGIYFESDGGGLVLSDGNKASHTSSGGINLNSGRTSGGGVVGSSINLQSYDGAGGSSLVTVNNNSIDLLVIGGGGLTASATGIDMEVNSGNRIRITDTISTFNDVRAGAAKTGIQLTGFGETDISTEGAVDYSNLIFNSLAPVKYVDDAITASAFTLTSGNGTTANGTAADLGGTLASDVLFETTGQKTSWEVTGAKLLEINSTGANDLILFLGTFTDPATTKTNAYFYASHDPDSNNFGSSVSSGSESLDVVTPVNSRNKTGSSNILDYNGWNAQHTFEDSAASSNKIITRVQINGTFAQLWMSTSTLHEDASRNGKFDLISSGATMEYGNDGGTFSSIEITLAAMTITDTINSVGLVGAAYFGGTAGDNNYAQQKFVNDAITAGAFALTSGNGTTANGTAVDLGGVLASTAIIDNSSFSLQLGAPIVTEDASHSFHEFGLVDTSIEHFYQDGTGGRDRFKTTVDIDQTKTYFVTDNRDSSATTDSVTTKIWADAASEQMYMRYQTGTGHTTDPNTQSTFHLAAGYAKMEIGVGGTFNSLEMNNTGQFAFEDNINGIGLQYAANYHGGYTLRTLVDKEFVELAITAAALGTDFQADVLAVQTDAVLDPTASPATGARYILTNVAALHANFGSPAGVADNDIVQYDGADFIVAYDVSVEGEGALVWDQDSNTFQRWDGTSWTEFGGLSGVTAGNGLTKSTNTLHVGAGAGITVNADDVAVNYTAVATQLAGGGLTANGTAIDLGGTLLASTTIEGNGNNLIISTSAEGVDSSDLKLLNGFGALLSNNDGVGARSVINLQGGTTAKMEFLTDISDKMSIEFQNSFMRITDEINSIGLDGAAYFGGTAGDNNYAQQKFVNDAITAGAFALTSGNGTTANGSAVDLGGVLASTVSIDVATFGFNLTDGTNNIFGFTGNGTDRQGSFIAGGQAGSPVKDIEYFTQSATYGGGSFDSVYNSNIFADVDFVGRNEFTSNHEQNQSGSEFLIKEANSLDSLDYVQTFVAFGGGSNNIQAQDRSGTLGIRDTIQSNVNSSSVSLQANRRDYAGGGGGVEVSNANISVSVADGIVVSESTIINNGIRLAGYGATDINTVGAADYSGLKFNSLVPRLFVENAITAGAFALTSGNGTTANGTTLDLGGVLTADISYTDSTTNSRNILVNLVDGVNTSIAQFDIFRSAASSYINAYAQVGDLTSNVSIQYNTLTMLRRDTSSGTQDQSLSFNGSDMLVTDSLNSIGFVGAADYSGTPNPLAYAQQAYVDAAAEAAGQFSITEGTRAGGDIGIHQDINHQGAGQINLTNLTSAFTGTATDFDTGGGLTDYFQLWVNGAGNGWYFCYIDSITDDFNASAATWYTDGSSSSYTSSSSGFPGSTGTYDYYYYVSEAKGNTSIALGYESFAYGTNSMAALGGNARSARNLAIGQYAHTAASNAICIMGDFVTGSSSVAIGSNSNVWEGSQSLALLGGNVTGSNSMAFNGFAYSDDSFVFGQNARTGYAHSFDISGTTLTIVGKDVTGIYSNGDPLELFGFDENNFNFFSSSRSITSVPVFSAGDTTFTINSGISGGTTSGQIASKSHGNRSHAIGYYSGVGSLETFVSSDDSYNFSVYDNSATAAMGIHTNFSTILGGRNNGISSAAGTYVTLLGLDTGAADASVSNTVYLPKVRIGKGSNATVATAVGSENVIVIDAATGELKQLSQGSLGSGVIGAPSGSDKDQVPAVTSGDGQTTTLTMTSTPTGLLIVSVNGIIVSVGDGVKTKFCYFSDDGGTSAVAIASVVATNVLYWNGVVAGYDLAATDLVDFYYI